MPIAKWKGQKIAGQQQWDNYPISPVSIADCPYQLVCFAGAPRLYVSAGPFLHVPGTGVFPRALDGLFNRSVAVGYVLVGGVWVYSDTFQPLINEVHFFHKIFQTNYPNYVTESNHDVANFDGGIYFPTSVPPTSTSSTTLSRLTPAWKVMTKEVSLTGDYQIWNGYPQSPVKTVDYPYQIVFKKLGTPSGVEDARLIAYTGVPEIFWRSINSVGDPTFDDTYVWVHHWYETLADEPVSYKLVSGAWVPYTGPDHYDDVFLNVDGVAVRAFSEATFDIYSADGEGETYLTGQLTFERTTIPTHPGTYQWWYGGPPSPELSSNYPYQALIKWTPKVDGVAGGGGMSLILSETPIYLVETEGILAATSTSTDTIKVYAKAYTRDECWPEWVLSEGVTIMVAVANDVPYGPPEYNMTLSSSIEQNRGPVYSDSSLATVAYVENIDRLTQTVKSLIRLR